MERQFHKEDFERLLRDNANQYRMYPSERVWKGVYSALHTRRKWYGLSALLLLLIGTTAISYTILNKNSERPIASITDQANVAISTILSGHHQADQIKNTPVPTQTSEENITSYSEPVFNPVTVTTISTEQPLNSNVGLTESETPTSANLLQQTLTDVVVKDPVADVKNDAVADVNPDTKEVPLVIESKVTPEIPEDNKSDVVTPTTKTPENIQQEIMALASQNAPIQVKGKTAKLTAQVYFTPTVSYRKLSENKAYSNAVSAQNPGVVYTQFVDVNTVVNHKPKMGLEVGIEGRYAITDRIAVKVGAQFNINRYDIRAYFHPTEFATIALNSGSGPDSVMTLSNYRNFSGATVNWLENFYFTASVPLGAEFIVFDNKKIQWGVAGSVQPSYVIGDRAYLISKDYKNYAKVPNLMRRLNISTDFETFISYSTGRLRWQVGPQVRYQHLSSFVNEYPVKENLFDIGLKIGASINKK